MSTTYPTDPREAAAELVILERFDWIRSSLGHDYGNGQRRAEINRRNRMLNADGLTLADDALGIDTTRRTPVDPLTDEELGAAFDRVGRPRLRRLEGPEAWRARTASSSRTLTAWQQVARFYALERAESTR